MSANEGFCRYANGKATAIVVDVGHYNTSVTAVWEGMVLRKSMSTHFLFRIVSVFMMIKHFHDGRHSQFGIDETALDRAFSLISAPCSSIQ